MTVPRAGFAGGLDDFGAAGVTSGLTVSGDDAERDQRSVTQWGLQQLLANANGQRVDSMREC